jgi:hypothetical protein
MSIIGRIEDNDTLAVLKDDRSTGVLFYDRSGDNLSLYRLNSLDDLERIPELPGPELVLLHYLPAFRAMARDIHWRIDPDCLGRPRHRPGFDPIGATGKLSSSHREERPKADRTENSDHE